MRPTQLYFSSFCFAVLLACGPAHAGALEDCYAMAGGAMEGVTECMTRNLEGAQQRTEQNYERLMEVALAMDNANQRGYYVPNLSSGQRLWKESAEQQCEMNRISAGSGRVAQHFKLSCLIEAYQTRGGELQSSFEQLTSAPKP